MKSLVAWFYTIKGYLMGRKTYLVTTAGFLLNLWLVINPTALSMKEIVIINSILVFLGGAALRSAVSRV